MLRSKPNLTLDTLPMHMDLKERLELTPGLQGRWVVALEILSVNGICCWEQLGNLKHEEFQDTDVKGPPHIKGLKDS